MSAWCVTNGHIDVLVQALIVEGLIRPDQATHYGQMLWEENYHSVNVRYGDDLQVPAYAFHGIEAPLADGAVERAIHCYDYQCMEWDGYDQAPGMQFVRKLLEIIEARRPEGWDRENEDWPWGFDSIEQAIAR